MSHWRTLIESDVLRFVDINRDWAVQIVKVGKGKVVGAGGKSNGRAMLYFKDWPKPLACGSTVLSVVAGMHGTDTREWLGRFVTIFPDPTVTYGRDRVGGVRVRPAQPSDEAQKKDAELAAQAAAARAKAEQSGKGAA